MSKRSNIFTIPLTTSFLPCLANFVLEGRHLAAGTAGDPLTLSRTTIYLPTRRAVRELRAEFSNQLGTTATFLPTLRTLGDSEETETFSFLPNAEITPPKRVVNPLIRQVELAIMVKRWVEMISAQTRELYQDEDIVIPSSSAESLWLARQLAELIDQMETEEISWHALKNLVPQRDEYAGWWQLTLDFLQIAMHHWPDHLAELNASDPATHRRQLLDLRAKILTDTPPSAPVIAAGSTGSIPATARFLKAIASLPQGSLILPGLDQFCSQDAWQEITKAGEDHAQFGLSRLIASLGIERHDVRVLDAPKARSGTLTPAPKKRADLVSIALLPSPQTGHWRQLMAQFTANDLKLATEQITIVEAPAERQEAQAIAMILRDELENPDTNIALVTPDRNLARRVAAELKRFNLNVDDSGGSALTSFKNTIFLRLLIAIATHNADAVTLAAFVNHDLLIGAHSSNLPLGRLFEICLLRDVLEIPAPGKFADAMREFKQASDQNHHLPKMISALNEPDWQQLISFCQQLDTGFSPLIKLAADGEKPEPIALSTIFTQLQACARTLSRDEPDISLFGDDAGHELSVMFDEVTRGDYSDFSCLYAELLSVFDALVAGKTVRQAANAHPRISILGPLEARLQPLDTVIIAGLNEGTWPARHDSGPFLNRPMKQAIELSTPERRIGLAAHDFAQLMGHQRVFLTRAERVDNAPTVPSRWLQRLKAVCGETIANEMTIRGTKYLQWARKIDEPQEIAPRIERPCPKPPLTCRPTALSVTEIETWIRDPYAIYARHILKLSPLPPIGVLSEPALRGTILHDAAAQFIDAGINPDASNALDKFIAFTREQMDNNKIPDHIRALWLPRFADIARAFLKHESETQLSSTISHCEITGQIMLDDGNFKLRGRADRIDVLSDGSVEIMDYKTGSAPSAKAAQTLSPQLALEGAMIIEGGFASITANNPTALNYIIMKPADNFEVRDICKSDNANDLSIKMLTFLNEQITHYKNPDIGYLSRFACRSAQDLNGDYDHLARVREWSLGDDDDADATGENYE